MFVYNLFQMDTYRLRYFVAVAETGSLSKGAQLMGISHGGLSKAISTLEAEIGVILFRPQGRGLVITPEGKWFYQKAKAILEIADEVLRGRKNEQSSLRLGVSEVIAMTCSGSLAAELEVPMVIHETDVSEVEGKIMGDEIDFGISFIPSPKPELEYLKIGNIWFNSYARADLLNRANPGSLPFVVPTSSFPSNPQGYSNRDGWPQGIPREPYFSVSSFAIALNLLKAGRACIYMPDFIANQENLRLFGLLRIEIVKPLKSAESFRSIFLVKRQSVEESKEMKRVAKIIRRICCS